MCRKNRNVSKRGRTRLGRRLIGQKLLIVVRGMTYRLVWSHRFHHLQVPTGAFMLEVSRAGALVIKRRRRMLFDLHRGWASHGGGRPIDTRAMTYEEHSALHGPAKSWGGRSLPAWPTARVPAATCPRLVGQGHRPGSAMRTPQLGVQLGPTEEPAPHCSCASPASCPSPSWTGSQQFLLILSSIVWLFLALLRALTEMYPDLFILLYWFLYHILLALSTAMCLTSS
jgi:hypothetical protein